MSNNKQKNETGYVSEIPPKVKKYFFMALGIYALGFLLLYSIGESINTNGYVLRGFLAPALILTALIMIPYVLYKEKKK